MVKFTVHTLGEHIIDNLQVYGPAKDVVGAMLDLFLATYHGPADGDLDFQFAEYVIRLSSGQGTILDYTPPPAPQIQ
jgi:hypothetical protein